MTSHRITRVEINHVLSWTCIVEQITKADRITRRLNSIAKRLRKYKPPVIRQKRTAMIGRGRFIAAFATFIVD